MDDRSIMENILLTTKGVCDLYLHGAIESSTANVHSQFDKALNESLCMQNEIIQRWRQRDGILPNRQNNRKFSMLSRNSLHSLKIFLYLMPAGMYFGWHYF